MPSISLPLVVTLLLGMVFLRMLRGRDRAGIGDALSLFVGVCAVQAVVALRWGYDSEAARVIQPIIATALPAIAGWASAAWVTPAAAPASLAVIATPVSIIDLGKAGAQLTGLDPGSLQRLIRNQHFVLLPDATPFSGFSLCTRQAAVLFAGEDEAICGETSAQRQAIHDSLAETIDRALRWGLAAP